MNLARNMKKILKICLFLSSEGKGRRRRAASMSESEIMTILIMFHFGTFDNFKHPSANISKL